MVARVLRLVPVQGQRDSYVFVLILSTLSRALAAGSCHVAPHAIIKTIGYGVSMGNGLTVQGNSICTGVGLSLQNLEIVEDFLPIDLGGTDVVLGMQ